jgi:FtsP/CotA-like multicopper oxidase with cupredoxin domain
MSHPKRPQPRNFVLTLLLLCLWSLPHLAAAGTVPPIPSGPLDSLGRPATPDYYTTANWANSPPLAKFVDTLPGLGSSKANNLGQYLAVGKPDTTSYPGSDYYEIELVEYKQRMHSDLPAPGTLLRGYVQVNKGTNLSPGTLPSQNKCGADQHACSAADTTLAPDPVRYLGPTLVTERDRPVRIKFTNKLPTGEAGKLFIPVDTTVMGAGPGPAFPSTVRGQGAACDNTMEPNGCASYPQNRGDLHLHGGRTPWISDGTPHQWITPAGELTPFAKGVSVQNVPDMPDPGDGSSTYYYTNQQSARLMFYHDHAFGITRLNVYAGEAAGYLITDQWEQDLISRGVIPADQIPLILQDKTYVDATPVNHPVTGAPTTQVRVADPLWNWGSGPLLNGVRTPVTGDLWLPHVYMPAQTSVAGFGGVNPFGRWMYGPWFYPATVIEKGPVANPYYDADCSSPIKAVYANCSTPGQPVQIPGTPNVSMGMEAFQDSAVVNGTAFPSLTVDPRAYRFRILNAASDRFWNLSFYQADPAQVSPDTRPASRLTEVRTVPASANLAAANGWPVLWPVDGRDGGVPDPAFRGPSFLQIGSEGGFLPQPVQIDPQPITYVTDPTAFWVGNVDKMGLALGPAERADVIVDFSAYAGQTLILYNDAPAAWPARVAGYDYYTQAPDLRDSGGFGTGGHFNSVTGSWEGGTGPLVGYAPNTRTVMQVIVRSSAVDAPYSFDPARLAREFTRDAEVTPLNPAPARTLFERAQEPIIVGQAAYSAAYPDSYFPPNFPWEGIAQINDQSLQFVTLAGEPVVVPTEPKGIHDEMGASFDPVYGRMSGNLAMQIPNPTTLTSNLILYGFSDLPTETISNSTQAQVTVLPGTTNLADGTQIWKISHNGVDTHPIHFHIFDVQLINRVGWDGQILMPEPNELGWKDTVKISPLEDTVVAVRPRAPALPFGINNSVRLLNPAIPPASPMGFNSIDWTTGNAFATPVTNILYDFGWEYVWHCHILSHEEMDMMRPIVLQVATAVPAKPTGLAARAVSASRVNLSWGDPTPVDYPTRAGFGNPQGEIGFRVERRTGTTGAYSVLGRALANATSFDDVTAQLNKSYSYRVVAYNASGDSAPSSAVTLTTPKVFGTILINGGAAATNSVNVTLSLSAVSSSGTVTQMQFSKDGGLTWSAFETFVTTRVVFLAPAGDGVKTVAVRYRDSAGNVSAAFSAAITLDTTLPVGSIQINGGATSTNSAAVTLTLSASDAEAVTQMQFSQDGGATWSAFESYATTRALTLTPAGGVKTVAVRFKDALGTVSLPYTATITLILAPPTGSILIEGGATVTHSASAVLTLSASSPNGAVTQMQFSKDGGASWSGFETFASIRTVTLAPAGDGIKTVAVRYRDALGTLSASYSAAIMLTTPPPTGTITINGGAALTRSASLTLSLTAASVASTVTQMQISKDNGATWAALEPYSGSKTLLPLPDGVQTIGVQYMDALGNLSPAYFSSITIDTVGPTGNIVINGGAAATNSASPTLTLTAADPSGVTQMQFSKDGGSTWSTPEPFAGTRTIYNLSPAGDGLKTVSVRFIDAAGNSSASYSASILLDTTAPSGSILINDGATSSASATVTLTLSASDLAGVASMQFSKDGGVWSPLEPYATSRTLLPFSTTGNHTVSVRFKDSVGNLSPSYTAAITIL